MPCSLPLASHLSLVYQLFLATFTNYCRHFCLRKICSFPANLLFPLDPAAKLLLKVNTICLVCPCRNKDSKWETNGQWYNAWCKFCTSTLPWRKEQSEENKRYSPPSSGAPCCTRIDFCGEQRSRGGIWALFMWSSRWWNYIIRNAIYVYMYLYTNFTAAVGNYISGTLPIASCGVGL